jgi:hypothetical protein
MTNLEISLLLQKYNKNEIEIITNVYKVLNDFHKIKQEIMKIKTKQLDNKLTFGP